MKIAYIGEFSFSESMHGPAKVGKRISQLSASVHDVIFIRYFLYKEKNWIFKKLFGKRVDYVNGLKVYTVGIFPLLRLLFEFKPDIIHGIVFLPFYQIIFPFKRFLKAKVLYTVNGVVKYESRNFLDVSLYYRFRVGSCEKTYINGSDLLFVLSEQELKVLQEEYKTLDLKKVRFIYNGVDEIFYKTPSSRSDSILKVVFPPLTNRKEKGLVFFKEIIEQVTTPIEVYLSDSIAHNTKFSNPKIEVKTFSMMTTPELARFWSDKDVVVLPGVYETFSISVAEAMVAGVIPIVSENVGLSRYIKSYENGLVFKLDNTAVAASFLDKLSLSFDLRKKLSGKAREIYQLLTWDKVFKEYNLYYNQLAGAKDLNNNARL
jgi:glycosyltransferase involved in cell wall biosynthesis